MKKHVISVSRHNLTRCGGCGRHHEIDQSLSSEELLSLNCQFCGSKLIGASLPTPRIASRSSKIAMGLLSASLAFTACDDDDEVVRNPTAGEMAGVEMVPAGDDSGQPEYGVFPAGSEEAGEEMVPAGDASPQPAYGVFPAGEEMAGVEMGGEMAGVEMVPAGDDSGQPEYGVFPAGEEVAGEEVAGEEVAGEEVAGEEMSGVEMVPAGDDSGQPEYGVPPAGSEG